LKQVEMHILDVARKHTDKTKPHEKHIFVSIAQIQETNIRINYVENDHRI